MESRNRLEPFWASYLTLFARKVGLSNLTIKIWKKIIELLFQNSDNIEFNWDLFALFLPNSAATSISLSRPHIEKGSLKEERVDEGCFFQALSLPCWSWYGHEPIRLRICSISSKSFTIWASTLSGVFWSFLLLLDDRARNYWYHFTLCPENPHTFVVVRVVRVVHVLELHLSHFFIQFMFAGTFLNILPKYILVP